MQDRYAGDVGDYGKIGLLKCLQAHGFTIGVNWYRVLELDVDLVFMDPDNGLLVKSVGKESARSVKYAFYEEAKDYIDSGKSVLVYNHWCRKPEHIYLMI